MTQIVSKPRRTFDITAASFRGAARDLGEVLAMLAGGVKPDAEALSRLSLSMRLLQGFLLDEAEEQGAREELAYAIDAVRVSPLKHFPEPAPLTFDGSTPVLAQAVS